MNKIISCGCGCGSRFTLFDKRGRKRKFKPGHNAKIYAPGVEKIKNEQLNKHPVGKYWRADGKHWRTCRVRARSLINTDRCSWEHIGHCKGPIQAAHIDGDYTNNNLNNITSLCASHHKLLDNKRIDPNNPKMPYFYTDKSGKRRYKYPKEEE